MIEDKTKIIYGIIGLLVISGTIGGYVLLTPEQLANARTCTTNNITGIFERFSSSEKTAYWTENRTELRSVCTNGVWIPTKEWLKINNLKIEDITIKPVEPSIVTEDNIEIIIDNKATIVIDKDKTLNIAGVDYIFTYIEKPPKIKCICDKIGGCKIAECIQ